MYCLLSEIINAAICATVPGHNRWPISTQLLFMRLSQPSAVPQAPDRRDGEITLSLGGPKVIICEEFVEWELCELAVTATSTVASHAPRVWAQKQERLNCSVIALLCCLNRWCVIERGHLRGGRKRLASNQTLSPRPHGTSPFILFFFILFWFLGACT